MDRVYWETAARDAEPNANYPRYQVLRPNRLIRYPMSYAHTTEMTVLFADVAGSVELYETLGDVEAHQMLVHCLQSMADLVGRSHGRVVETIGDAIMCVFPNPDFSIGAACDIQQYLRDRTSPTTPLNVRIGFHTGPITMDRGHPFGDTVNVAARIADAAKAGQILITQETYIRLSSRHRQNVRHYKKMLLKGKAQPCITHEVVWDQNECTRQYHSSKQGGDYRPQPVTHVKLVYGDQQNAMDIMSPDLVVGRGEQCSIRVLSDLVSRLHAVIKCARGNFILSDQSTNGTYVKTREGNRANDNLQLFLHHQDWVMAGTGLISLGSPQFDANEHVIEFYCE